MFGIYFFPAKTADKDYEYKKDPKKVLKLEDSELVMFARHTKGVHYYHYYNDDKDELTPEEKLEYFKSHWASDYSELKKIRGYDGYTSSDGKDLIKIIVKPYNWFKDRVI